MADGRLYALAVYLSAWLDRGALEEAVADYAAYLNEPGDHCYREAPEEFGRARRKSRLQRRPAWRAMAAAVTLAALAAGVALCEAFGTMAQQTWAMTALAAGVPFAMWALLGGGTAAAVSPQGASRRAPVWALGSALAAILVMRCWLLFAGGRLLAGLPDYMAGAAANIVVMLGQLVALTLFVMAVRRTLRRSAYYLCHQAQALALWTLLRSAQQILRRPWPQGTWPTPSLLPFAAGWIASLALWFLLRSLYRRGAE